MLFLTTFMLWVSFHNCISQWHTSTAHRLFEFARTYTSPMARAILVWICALRHRKNEADKNEADLQRMLSFRIPSRKLIRTFPWTHPQCLLFRNSALHQFGLHLETISCQLSAVLAWSMALVLEFGVPFWCLDKVWLEWTRSDSCLACRFSPLGRAVTPALRAL